jgi:hypothetical protein
VGHSGNSFGGSDGSEQKGSANVEHESQREAGEHADDPAQNGKGVEFAEEQGNHEGGLNRTDAAASFVNPDDPGADLDDIAMLRSGDAAKSEEFDGGRRVPTHQGLSE